MSPPSPTRRIVAVLNSGGGGFKPNWASDLKDIAGGSGSLEIRTVAGPQLADALKQARSADWVIVLGGDGTLTLAASILGPTGPPLVALPGGTMNRLAYRLYGKGDWRETLRRTLADPQTSTIGGGKAGEELFLISAIFGMPSDWSRAREALRKGRLGEAINLALTGFRRAMSRQVAYRSKGLEGTAHAVEVRCAGPWSIPPQAPGLEAAALNANSLAASVRLGADALLGDWRENPDVRMLDPSDLRLLREGGVPAMLDGESRNLASPVEVRYLPEAFRLLAPAGAGPSSRP